MLTGPLILIETAELKLGDEFTYQFCDQISQVCGVFRSIPETESLVLEYDGFCKLVSHMDVIIEKASYDLAIPQKAALEQAQLFLMTRMLLFKLAESMEWFIKLVSTCNPQEVLD